MMVNICNRCGKRLERTAYCNNCNEWAGISYVEEEKSEDRGYIGYLEDRINELEKIVVGLHSSIKLFREELSSQIERENQFRVLIGELLDLFNQWKTLHNSQLLELQEYLNEHNADISLLKQDLNLLKKVLIDNGWKIE